MTIRAFECTRSWDEIPVTIFAENLDHAEQIYRAWVINHHEGRPAEPTAIFVFGDDRLAARPHLEKAAALGVAGVAYWDAGKCSWNIRKPEEEPTGDLAPPERDVSFYQFRADDLGDDAKVFATSYHEATNLYCVWHLDRWGELPARFSIDKRSRWELLGECATLRDGLEAGVIGVGAYDLYGVLRVLPPDYEPVIGRE